MVNNNNNGIFRFPNPLRPDNLVLGLTSVSPPKLSPLPILKDIQEFFPKRRSLRSGSDIVKKSTDSHNRQHRNSNLNTSVLSRFNNELDNDSDEHEFVATPQASINIEDMKLLEAAHLDYALLSYQTSELTWKDSVTSFSKLCSTKTYKPGCYFFHFYNYEENKSIRLYARAHSHGKEIYCVKGDHVRVLAQTSFTWNIKCQKEFEITISLHLVGSITKVATFEFNVYKEQLNLKKELVSSISISNMINEDLDDMDENESSDDESDEDSCRLLSPSSRSIICSSDWDVY